MRSTAGWVRGVRGGFVVLVALAVGTAVSACHAPQRTPTVSGPDHNADDVTFLQAMVPYHEQALELAEMVPAHTTDTRLITLAHQIGDEQQSEINGFRAQLIQWQQPLHDPRGMHVDGMVDQATMDKLKALSGPAFDQLWLQSMIARQQGAITMTHNEIAHGQSPDIIDLAKSIAASQQAEVDQMEQMLRR